MSALTMTVNDLKVYYNTQGVKGPKELPQSVNPGRMMVIHHQQPGPRRVNKFTRFQWIVCLLRYADFITVFPSPSASVPILLL